MIIMNPNAQEHLLQDVLDGSASPAQRAELENLLSTDETLRTRRAELVEVMRVLGDASAEVAPPTELHATIMAAINAEPRNGVRRTARGWHMPRPWLQLCGGFLAGAAAAALVVVSIQKGPGAGLLENHGEMSGTLAPNRTGSWPIVSTASLATPQGKVELVTHRLGERVRLEIR